MNHTRIVVEQPRPTGATSMGTGTIRALPAELARIVPGRLEFLARLELAVWGVALLNMLVAPMLPGVKATHAMLLPQYAVTVLMAGMSVLVRRIARDESLSIAFLVKLGLAFEILTAAAVAMLENGLPHNGVPVPSGASYACVWVVFYPLVVPALPRAATVASLVGALMPAVTLLLMKPIGISDRAYADLGPMVLNAGVATVLASVSSRFVYRLGRSVDKAKELGSYRLIKLLGKGGMGEVWTAHHRFLARPAAIKLISPDGGQDQPDAIRVARERFEREAQATASLESPHTVALYDFGVSDEGVFYYVMEHLRGIDLHGLVAKFGLLPAERVIHIVGQICRSLEEAHRAGLYHRDIKPANVMLCEYGGQVDFVKVLDFGLVRWATDGEGGLDAGRIVGTPAFMAPEAVRAPDQIDGRADLYAVACIAYWLLTGAFVFDGGNSLDVAVKRLREPAPSIASRGIITHPGLERVIMKALATRREERQQSVGEFAAQLEELNLGEWTETHARHWWDTHAVIESEGS